MFITALNRLSPAWRPRIVGICCGAAIGIPIAILVAWLSSRS